MQSYLPYKYPAFQPVLPPLDYFIKFFFKEIIGMDSCTGFLSYDASYSKSFEKQSFRALIISYNLCLVREENVVLHCWSFRRPFLEGHYTHLLTADQKTIPLKSNLMK